MTHGSLFSGIGGFDLAAEWMGWENVFHCEINEFCNKILNHYWPDAKGYTDITKTDFSQWKGKVDIISGGFPCQPYSQAGKRKGKADDRHLWPEMLRAIREVQPMWIVGENVSGLLNWKRGMVLAEIKADLESAGFEVFPPCILPACGKNASHRRDRLWIVAHNNKRNGSEHELCARRNLLEKRIDRTRITANSISQRLESIQRKSANNGKKLKTIERGYNWWEIWPTQPPVCGGNDGISNRVDRIKALGNAIVPQIAFEIFKAIETIK